MTLGKRLAAFAVMLGASWCMMTFTHEMGHLIGGWASGAELRRADLRPWKLPYSIFSPDPHPLITLWAGPLLGVLVPVAMAWLVRWRWMGFVAHFCLLANGVYLAAAWYAGGAYLDTTKLLEHGAWPSSIALYCLLTIGFGYRGFRRDCLAVFAPSHIAAEEPGPTLQ
ncbi:hypothetical protein [Lignipirellula cremea]|uniref:MraY-like glycosyltransferase n=1 Tax=Lignipirellula cremea TaxID=2528010 RepID=A0A518DS61_9BACT|nr:hypothetical protein [Lignipirellula cremea]QDU94673.1 hypothetical protein Pla8534_24790 [Lignipirellula cremea]